MLFQVRLYLILLSVLSHCFAHFIFRRLLYEWYISHQVDFCLNICLQQFHIDKSGIQPFSIFFCMCCCLDQCHIVKVSLFLLYPLVQPPLLFCCSCSHVLSFVLYHVYLLCNVKLKDLQSSWAQVQRCWLSRTLLIPSPSLTPQVIFLSQHDTERAMPLILSGLSLAHKYILRAYESFFIYQSSFWISRFPEVSLWVLDLRFGICTWSYLVDIASNLTVAPCQFPWIETVATARSHLICRSVLLLLPGNAKDKFSFVNWIALLLEEPAYQCH